MAIFTKGVAEKVHYRTADRCCANCAWMEWSRDCCGPCYNPVITTQSLTAIAIVDDCGVCDLWEQRMDKEEDDDEPEKCDPANLVKTLDEAYRISKGSKLKFG